MKNVNYLMGWPMLGSFVRRSTSLPLWVGYEPTHTLYHCYFPTWAGAVARSGFSLVFYHFFNLFFSFFFF
jgi:hypothetical protein